MTSLFRPVWAGPVVALLLLVMAGFRPVAAQTPPTQQQPIPPQIQQFIQSLQDPAVRTWLERHSEAATAPQAQVAQPTGSGMMTQRIAGLREHLKRLAAAVPRLPAEIRTGVGRLLDEQQERNLPVVLVAAFLALGAGAEWLFRRVTAAPRQRIRTLPMTTVADRLRIIAVRLAFWLSEVAIFALARHQLRPPPGANQVRNERLVLRLSVEPRYRCSTEI